jgi:cyclase
MRKIRLIPRLDIKGENLIKGIQLEGVRVIGKPNDYAVKYYKEGADELLYMDAVASLYGRNNLKHLISECVKNVFIPITVGGGIRSIEDASEILRSGADKVAMNTAAVKNPKLISDLVNTFGSSTIVISIEAKLKSDKQWEVYVEGGREKTGLDVSDWAIKVEKLGAGEILLTSVDREGTRKGYDINLIKSVTQRVSVPVVASGGMSKPEDLVEAVKNGKADAVSMADILHYNRINLKDIRKVAIKNNINTRKFNE